MSEPSDYYVTANARAPFSVIFIQLLDVLLTCAVRARLARSLDSNNDNTEANDASLTLMSTWSSGKRKKSFR